MNDLRQLRDKEIQTIILLTRYKSLYLTWKHYEEFINSDSESIGCYLLGYVNVNEIVTIGYAPKEYEPGDLKYRYIDL